MKSFPKRVEVWIVNWNPASLDIAPNGGLRGQGILERRSSAPTASFK